MRVGVRGSGWGCGCWGGADVRSDERSCRSKGTLDQVSGCGEWAGQGLYYLLYHINYCTIDYLQDPGFA